MTAAFGFSPRRTLRADAVDIWSAGVAAVDSARLVRQSVRFDGRTLEICGLRRTLSANARIRVVGGGKAAAGMAAGLEQALGLYLSEVTPAENAPSFPREELRIDGWLNVPADCLRPLSFIHLHPARPAALNEPTAEGVAGTERILEMVQGLRPEDVCLVLLSGGGSALLPAPVEGVSLSDKQTITRFLSRAGASIHELNCVRKQLSRIKGGRLAAACRAGTLISLMISDVIADPLDIIASGPTVPDPGTPADALAVLRKFDPHGEATPGSVLQWLSRPADDDAAREPQCEVFNHIIGNNRLALDAAAERARQLGYRVEAVESDRNGEARDEGAALAMRCRTLRGRLQAGDAPLCIITGGEPVVHLRPSDRPQKGGRNQELVLAALDRLWNDDLAGLCLLSGGTDGEDGPTDAAGAVIDQSLAEQARRGGLAPQPFLDDHNAYPFFEATGGHLKTGPTQTNVMDVRVALVALPAA